MQIDERVQCCQAQRGEGNEMQLVSAGGVTIAQSIHAPSQLGTTHTRTVVIDAALHQLGVSSNENGVEMALDSQCHTL